MCVRLKAAINKGDARTEQADRRDSPGCWPPQPSGSTTCPIKTKTPSPNNTSTRCLACLVVGRHGYTGLLGMYCQMEPTRMRSSKWFARGMLTPQENNTTCVREEYSLRKNLKLSLGVCVCVCVCVCVHNMYYLCVSTVPSGSLSDSHHHYTHQQPCVSGFVRPFTCR